MKLTNDQAKNDNKFVKISMENATMRVDIESTRNGFANTNAPCDCPSCRNYYKAIRTKPNILAFLDRFGIDADRPEELYSWGENAAAKTIIYNAWYAVSGEFAGDKILKNIDGAEIELFSNTAYAEKTAPFFWLNIKDICLPWMLNEMM